MGPASAGMRPGLSGLGAAAKPVGQHHPAAYVPWGMAFTAMPRSLHQIATTRQNRIGFTNFLDRSGPDVQPLPQAEAAPDAERKPDFGRLA